jgi:hypothetical protein
MVAAENSLSPAPMAGAVRDKSMAMRSDRVLMQGMELAIQAALVEVAPLHAERQPAIV